LLFSPVAFAATIGIIIDDIGYSLNQGRSAIALPSPVTLALLPDSPYARELAVEARNHHHELMLHLPMQSADPAQPLEVTTLVLDMPEEVFKHTVTKALADYPEIAGVNNHMGSLLTRHPGHMAWLMEILAEQGLYFVDSRTTDKTVGAQLASEFAIPHTSRNVFLDDLPRDAGHVRRQLRHLERVATAQGFALAIGHPYPETLQVLHERLPELKASGIRLLPVSEYIHEQMITPPLWHAYSSHSLKAAKNSKPSP
jgi:polysaccharide deacetylase 2 family uncharacterized protein YibQ